MMHPQSQAEHPVEDFDVRPQAIERWLKELPRGSVGKTSELIFKALQNIDSQELKGTDRLRVLETMRDSVHYVTSNMNKHVTGVAYPLPDKIMRIASACQTIYDNMAQGYTKVFHDLQKQNSLFVDNKILTTAVHRSIVFIEHSLLITYEVYSAFYHDYWEQLHELYQYAELHKLTDSPVHDPLVQPKYKSSIKNEYIRTLLLYLAEPYHLRAGEINDVHHHLKQWSGLCELEKVKSGSELMETKLPIVELDGDRPPKLAVNGKHNSAIENCRILNTDKLIHTLKKEHKHLSKNRPSLAKQIANDKVSISLFRRLIESWGHTRQRRFPRQLLNDKVNVTVGLHHTHMQLMYEQHLKTTEQNRDTYSGFHQPKSGFEQIEIKSVEDEHSDVWSTVYAWANTISPKSEQQSKRSQQAKDKQTKSIVDYRVKQDNWTLSNESAEGFGLIVTENPSNKIQVGEIISVQRKNSNERSVGLVRWMKARGGTGIEMGVMLLAPSAIPVGLIFDDPTGGDYVIDRGLILPLMQVLNRPESLLSFSRQYKPGDVLRINRPGSDNIRIKLIKLIADNGAVSQYLFTRIENTLFENKDSVSAASSDDDRFSDIWQSI